MRVMDRFFSTEQLGPTQSVTPEGFLLCEGVAIARTGVQEYLEDEVPIEGDFTGQVRVHRDEGEVFRADTMASFEGKPVTMNHPNDFVNPANWKELAVGIVQNVRRGKDVESGLLIADLMITDQSAIDAVRAGLREVSCGYEAEYEQVQPGMGRQVNIIGNHVALVERGRAGPRCSIQDKEPTMKSKKQSFADRLRKAFMAKDSDEAEKLAKEAEDADPDESEGNKEMKDALASFKDEVMKRMDSIEAMIKDGDSDDTPGQKADEAEEKGKKETGDDSDMDLTGDTVLNAETLGKIVNPGVVYTGDSLKTAISLAEILSPGIQIQTGDSVKVKDAVPSLQRRALEAALAGEVAAKVKAVVGDKAPSTLTGDALAKAFTAAAEVVRQHNNAQGTRHESKTRDFGGAVSVSDINAKNRDFWAKRAG